MTVNVTEHQLLEIPICMLHGDTRKGAFPTNVKSTVQYGENLQALSVALNTVGAVSVKRTHEIPVSYTHLDVYKRQAMSRAYRRQVKTRLNF